jgi:hypothetical protein
MSGDLDAEERAAFTADFKALERDQQPVMLELTKVQAWILASELQLALRHPGNTGPSALIAREIAKRIHGELATTPTLRSVAAKGWDPQFDEAPTDERWASGTLAAILEHLQTHAAHCEHCTRWCRGHGGTVPTKGRAE